MYWVLLMVVVIGSASFGQVDGPWTIWELDPDQRILRPELVVQPSGNVDIFFVVRDTDSTEELRHTSFSFASHTSTLPFVVATNDSSWLSIGAASRLDNNRWAVLCYDTEIWRVGEYLLWNRTRLYAGDVSVETEVLVDAGELNISPFPGGSANSNLRLVPRVGGGVVASWTTNGSQDGGGFSEPLYGAAIKLYTGNLELSEESWGAIHAALYGSREFIAMSSDEVSVEIVSVDDALNGVLAYYPAEQGQYAFEIIYCGWYPLLFWRSASDQRLVLTSDFDMPIYHLIQLTEGANCEELSSMSLNLYGGIMATEPEFGIATAYFDPHFVHLLRWNTGEHVPGVPGYFIERPNGVRMDSAAIAIGDDGHVIVVWTEASGTGMPNQLMIARVAWDDPLGTSSTSKPVPIQFALTAFPNPFNSELRIRYDVGRAQAVSLRVFDLTGREVVTLAAGMQSAGKHDVSWNAGSFSSGVYFVRLFAEEGSAVQKVLLMK